ncbi:MAG TPA: hypothetical protein DEA94_06765 [Rhodobacteraceae bacterium]|nr:hypothetical protein [Paracoccaceae bacterium]HBS38380.1 hypothetical protein [Paracoccaceae bacterium]
MFVLLVKWAHDALVMAESTETQWFSPQLLISWSFITNGQHHTGKNVIAPIESVTFTKINSP